MSKGLLAPINTRKVSDMRILIIEDDVQLCESLTYQLKQEQITADSAHDGESGLDYALSMSYDLILLDRMLSHLDGISVLTKIRQAHNNTPVILLTALGSVKDRVLGLTSGADDYIVKPFAFEELLARIYCILRRPVDMLNEQKLTFGDITYSITQHKLAKDSLSCTLSKREGDLLESFLQHPNQTLPRNTLLDRVWGIDSVASDGNLDNYIHFLRRRLSQIQSRLILKTIRNVGYVLEDSHD